VSRPAGGTVTPARRRPSAPTSECPNKDVTGTMEELLSRLEAKVNEAVEIIQGLRRENSELGARCADLESRLQADQEQRARLERDLAEAREMAAQVEGFEEKRRLVEEKVGGLLSKLEAMS